MTFLSQLGLLLWKNWILQKRRMCVSIFEIILPVFFAVMLVLTRLGLGTKEHLNATTYAPSEFTFRVFSYPNQSTFGFVPDTRETRNLMGSVLDSAKNISYCKLYNYCHYEIKGFGTEEQAVSFSSIAKDKMPFVVVFDGVSASDISLPKKVSYSIRPFITEMSRGNWETDKTFPMFQFGPRRSEGPDYTSNGVTFIQSVLGEAIANYWLDKEGKTPAHLNVTAQRLPYPPYHEDPLIEVVQSTLPMFLVLSFILSVIFNTQHLVYEKERKLKESMKLMGLRASAHYVSWFVTFAIYLIPALALYTLFLGLKFTGQHAVLDQTDPSLFFVFLLCYGFALITFCFMVSSFVQKANIGAVVAGVLFFATYIPVFYFAPRYDSQGKSAKLATGLLFNGAMALGTKVIGIYESTGEGAQWSNFTSPATVDDNISLLECMLMLVADSFIHCLVAWYLDNIWPGDFGVPRPYFFLFTKSYWCGSGEKSASSYEVENKDTKHFEKDPANMRAGIKISRLNKVFGNKVAVQDVSLQMYEGQITVLLGHNGAGKSTTMFMLTGFIPPTSGTALVNGCDIRDNIQGVRASLGLCPQHDVLFDRLTVKEHLSFFAKLKGCPSSKVEAEVIATVNDVGLETKLNARAASLSGGQKRKLSVGIALIGGSKVVILDEPTSGMDPAARRQTWTVLQRASRERTVMLSTHYMDEADVLGDRIAIMADGVVKCCGSSMFLKKLFGAGYHLVVVKQPHCDLDKLTAMVKSHVHTGQLETVVNTEVTYLLPETEVSHFAALFTALDENLDSLGISSFGTSTTTMEEVFLKVGDLADDEDREPGETARSNQVEGFSNRAPITTNSSDNFDQNDKTLLATSSDDQLGDITAWACQGDSHTHGGHVEIENMGMLSFNKGFTKKTGLALHWATFKALFIKKALYTWRSPVSTLIQVALPLAMLALGMAGTRSSPLTDQDSPPLRFDLRPFGKTYVPYTTGHDKTPAAAKFSELYKNQFMDTQNLEPFGMPPYEKFDNYTLKREKELGLGTYNKKMIIGMEVLEPVDIGTFAARAHYNGMPYHSLPVSTNYLVNTFLQYSLNNSFGLQSSIHMLPQDLESSSQSSLVDGFFISFFITFGMAFLTSLFVFFPVKEREVGAKHMQVVSGVGPVTFWLSSFSWDFINYIVPGLLMLVVFAIYDAPAYTEEGRLGVVVLLLCLFGWAILPFNYALQFVFNKPSTGVVVTVMFNIMTGLLTTMAVFILSVKKNIRDILDMVFMVVFPNYNFASSFGNMYTNYIHNEMCKNVSCTDTATGNPCCPDTCSSWYCIGFEKNYLSLNKPGIGTNLLLLVLQGFLCFLVVMLVEYHIFQRLWYFVFRCAESTGSSNEEGNISTEDSDVAAERRRINSNQMSSLSPSDVADSLRLVNLYKRYGSSVAVDNLCVGVPDNECFGLLGQNGAGKTTTFKMLTGDVMVTGGNAYLKGYDVRSNIKKVQSRMGYCPQFDALLDKMTGRETLTMYARLRGVPETNLPAVVNNLIDILMLRPHADKLTGNYSGGNKRKLSTAIALIGDPPFIMLDEPSSGMDPKARRQLWNILSRVRASGRMLFLTSHSMEECDALCTRLAIMVNGKFVCLGSPQHLKNKFGQGYTLTVQMTALPDGTTAPNGPLIDFIMQNFQGAQIFDDHQGYVHFQVPSAGVKLARVFSLMESTKANLSVEDYSVHQTTLEQVFLAFTRSQTMPTQDKTHNLVTKACCCLCIKMGLIE